MSETRGSLSVVMATLNGERFIAEQLESILSQTRLPDEIVVSDDGSTDTTLEIVRRFQKQSPASVSWQILESKKSRGPAGNFSRGLQASTGELIALSDQDDWWFPKKLATLEKVLRGNPNVLMVHSDADLVNHVGDLIGLTLSQSLRMTSRERRGLVRGDALKQLVRRNLVTGHTVMMRRELGDVAGDIPAGWLHDEWWGLIAAAHGRLLFLPRVLGHYRQHGLNQVGASRSGWSAAKERLAEPQDEFRSRHALRHDGVEDFLARSSSIPESARALLAGRIAHYRWQATLPQSRLGRVGPVLGKVMTGQYRRFRRGLFDAVRDVMQPATGGL